MNTLSIAIFSRITRACRTSTRHFFGRISIRGHSRVFGANYATLVPKRRQGMKCAVCDDTGWVCEEHPDKPWHARPGGCECGAGMPCLACNQPKEDQRPRMPADFVPHIDRDKGPIH